MNTDRIVSAITNLPSGKRPYAFRDIGYSELRNLFTDLAPFIEDEVKRDEQERHPVRVVMAPAEGEAVEAARTSLGLGPDDEDVATLDRVRELRRKADGYDRILAERGRATKKTFGTIDLWPHLLAALKRARDAATVNDSPRFLLGQLVEAFVNAGEMLTAGRVDAAIDLLADIEPVMGLDVASVGDVEGVAALAGSRSVLASCEQRLYGKATVDVDDLRAIVDEAAREPKAAAVENLRVRVKVREGMCDVYDENAKVRVP